MALGRGSALAQIPNGRQLIRRLRAGCERPRRCHAAEQRDQVAPSTIEFHPLTLTRAAGYRIKSGPAAVLNLGSTEVSFGSHQKGSKRAKDFWFSPMLLKKSFSTADQNFSRPLTRFSVFWCRRLRHRPGCRE